MGNRRLPVSRLLRSTLPRAMTWRMAPTTLSLRDLNRATLARQILLAYHRGERDLGDDELDAALGLPSQSWRWAPEREARLQAQHPGESVVNVATPYEVCRGIFTALSLEQRDLVVDLGCGAGRVVLYGALVSRARFRGIELAADRANQAREAAERLGLDRVSIVHGNVLDEDLGRGSVFYLFRPFSVETEAAVLQRLHDQARRRMITVATYRLQPSLFDPSLFERLSTGVLMIHRTRP